MSKESKDIRKPVVAGAFYPGTPWILANTVDDLLNTTDAVCETGTVAALIAPHAGYTYSGQTAAIAYRQVQNAKYDAVCVLAPSHRESFSGVSIRAHGAYETPLGAVPIHEDIAASVRQLDTDIHETEAGHRSEHAVEVQLPFIQRALGDVPLVPIVMADRSWRVCHRLATALAQVARTYNILIVASSDLYHGELENDCEEADRKTLDAVLEQDPEQFCGGLQTYDFQACGGGPIAVVMDYAQQIGCRKGRLLHHTTSAEVTGQGSGYVVGYGAIVYEKPRDTVLDEEQQHELLALARQSIRAAVLEQKPPTTSSCSPALKEHLGAFVTIYRKDSLRGCIGQMQGYSPLADTIVDMARSAAMEDPRFPPMNESELNDFRIEISVLTPMKDIQNPEEVIPGLHGLLISGRGRRGVLLPQVAARRNWDRTTFLENTCLKAGLPLSAWRDDDISIQTFTAEVFGE